MTEIITWEHSNVAIHASGHRFEVRWGTLYGSSRCLMLAETMLETPHGKIDLRDKLDDGELRKRALEINPMQPSSALEVRWETDEERDTRRAREKQRLETAWQEFANADHIPGMPDAPVASGGLMDVPSRVATLEKQTLLLTERVQTLEDLALTTDPLAQA